MLSDALTHLPGTEGLKPWTAAVPLVDKLQGADPTKPFFVDIRGDLGSQCVAFMNATKDRFPGRIILQDAHHVVERILPRTGVERMPQNLFDEQAVQGKFDLRHF